MKFLSPPEKRDSKRGKTLNGKPKSLEKRIIANIHVERAREDGGTDLDEERERERERRSNDIFEETENKIDD
jgi:hypothetical protein